MFLLDALRWILCCGQDEQRHDIYSYRSIRDYSSLFSPILRSRSSPENYLYRDESRPFLPSTSYIVESRGNLKSPDVTISHGDGNRAFFPKFYSPNVSSSVRDSTTLASLSSKPSFAHVSSTNGNISASGSSVCPEKCQIKKNSATCSPEKPYTASRPSKSPSFSILSSNAPAALSPKHLFTPVSFTNNNDSVTRLSTDSQRIQIMKGSATASQLSKAPSSSISSSAVPAPSSKKPPMASLSPTINQISAVWIPIGPEKRQISPERPGVATMLSQCDSRYNSSSAKDSFSPSTQSKASSSKNNSTVSSTNNNCSVARLSTDAQRIQIMKDSTTASQLSKAPSFSISSSTVPAPSSKKPPMASVSPTINQISSVWIPVGPEKLQISSERPGVATMLSQCDSPYNSSSAKDSFSPATQSKTSLSKNNSLATVSSTRNNSTRHTSVSVWQVKLPIPPGSTTKLSEKPCSSSLFLPFSRKFTFSPSSSSMPPVYISTATNSVSWKKNKRTLIEASRESVLNLPALSVNSDSSSLSEASSLSPLLESAISNRRMLPKYEIPKCLEEMIRNDIVPPILLCPLSPSTYGDFFATLLYAEDFYVEKWNEYSLEGITLELRSRINSINSQDRRDFVAFEIDSIPERRPYILSRDFVFLKPLNEIARPFQGNVFRVVKCTILLVEFGDDFHSQHSPSKRYDVSFSFNRVCLKRAHHAISVASDPSFQSILFPDQSVSSHPKTFSLHNYLIPMEDHAKRIFNHKGPIPYLVNGQLVQQSPCDQRHHETCLSLTGLIIQIAMLNIYKTNPHCRILVCAPTNSTSDVLLRSLKKEIPEYSLFRANAAYRNYNLVPDDILPASLYEEDEECFACPPVSELQNFNIITSTFMSSFRLFSAGIISGHFTHIFLVDASLATEPEAIVPLAHLADRNTVIVVTGSAYNSPSWVRSDIARRHGLKKSYFKRLLAREPYMSNDSMFITNIA